MKHYFSYFNREVSIHHLHMPLGFHQMHVRHAGHWMSDFPKTTSLMLSVIIAVLFVGILKSIGVNMNTTISSQLGNGW